MTALLNLYRGYRSIFGAFIVHRVSVVHKSIYIYTVYSALYIKVSHSEDECLLYDLHNVHYAEAYHIYSIQGYISSKYLYYA